MLIERRLIEGREVVDGFQSPAIDVFVRRTGRRIDDDLDERIAIVSLRGQSGGIERGVEGAVAGFYVERTRCIDGHDSARLPDAPFRAVRGRVEYAIEH